MPSGAADKTREPKCPSEFKDSGSKQQEKESGDVTTRGQGTLTRRG